MGYIRNAVLIEAPVESVFKLTNDVRTWPTLFTEYASSEVLEETDDTVIFRLTTHPDEEGHQWSWVSRRTTNASRQSTYSERLPPIAGPFEHMAIRWWYNQVGDSATVMTWEQEFTVNPQASVSEEQVTAYLNKQTKIQQQAIKTKVEQICASSSEHPPVYRGMIVGRYQTGTEPEIVDAFRRSDETELPHLLGVKSRHVWVLGDIYLHFVEGKASLPVILKDYANHPLFQAIKAELDTYVKPLSPDLSPVVARQIYCWQNTISGGTGHDD